MQPPRLPDRNRLWTYSVSASRKTEEQDRGLIASTRRGAELLFLPDGKVAESRAAAATSVQSVEIVWHGEGQLSPLGGSKTYPNLWTIHHALPLAASFKENRFPPEDCRPRRPR
jgi:hypothetical protein